MPSSYAIHLKSGRQCDVTFTETVSATDVLGLINHEVSKGKISDGLWINPSEVAAIETIKPKT